MSRVESLAVAKDNPFEISRCTDLHFGNKMNGTYSHDIDISMMHLIIRDIFSYHINNKDKTLSRISQYRKILENPSINYAKRRETLRLKMEDEEILKKFSVEEWEKYREKVRPILTEYMKVTTYTKSKTIVIGSKKKEPEETRLEQDLYFRLSLIRNFIRLGSKYVEMDIIFHPPFQIGCQACDTNVDHMEIDEDLGVYICSCGHTFGNVYSNETPHIDPDRVEAGSKTSYDDKTNFQRRLKSYQGFSTRKISKEFIDYLDKHMQDKYQHPPADIIRTLNPDRYGHRGEFTSVALLKEALRETNNTIHFQDINPICYELWGWVCPNIEHLVPKILDDYTRTQEVYKRLNPLFSSINVELRLYWHLRIAGHDCLLDDFKIPHSRDSKKRNSQVFQIMCRETGLPFFPIM